MPRKTQKGTKIRRLEYTSNQSGFRVFCGHCFHGPRFPWHKQGSGFSTVSLLDCLISGNRSQKKRRQDLRDEQDKKVIEIAFSLSHLNQPFNPVDRVHPVKNGLFRRIRGYKRLASTTGAPPLGLDKRGYRKPLSNQLEMAVTKQITKNLRFRRMNFIFPSMRVRPVTRDFPFGLSLKPLQA